MSKHKKSKPSKQPKQAGQPSRAERQAAHRERMQKKKEEFAKRQQERVTHAQQQPPPAAEPRPSAGARRAAEQAEERRWKEFREADLDTQIAQFNSKLAEPEWPGSFEALEMGVLIADNALKQANYERLLAFVRELHDASPQFVEAYRTELLQWGIQASLFSGNDAQLDAHARELAEHAEENADVFDDALQPLIYHGRLATLHQILRTAVPLLRENEDITPWGFDKHASWGMDCELFVAYEQGLGEPPDYEELMRRMRHYAPPRRSWLIAYSDALRATTPTRTWKLEDLHIAPPPEEEEEEDSEWVDHEEEEEEEEKPDEEGEPEEAEEEPVDPGLHNLEELSFEFVGWVHREKSLPLTRGEQMRRVLIDYFIGRAYQTINLDRRSMVDRYIKPLVAPEPFHALCPDKQTFDAFSGDLFSGVKPLPYQTFALFLSVPYWLEFLQSRALLSPELAARAIEEIAYLQESYVEMSEVSTRDPLLTQNLRDWGRSR